MASNRMSTRTNIAFLFAKLLALAIIIVGGIVALITGNNRGNSELSSGFEGTSDDATSVGSSFYFVMYAYGGWSESNMLVEEVKSPKRNVPLSAIVGVLGVTVIYVLTNVSYLAVMSRGEMLASDTVAVTWGNAVLGTGVASFIIPLCVIFSTTGSANAGTFVAPRLVFAAARDGVFPEVLSYLHVDKKTPVPAIAIIISLAVVYASVSTIRKLIILLNVADWFFAFLMSISLLIIRHRQPKDLHVPFKQPLPVIILFMLCSLYIVIMPWTKGVDFVLLYVVVFLIVGLLIFFLFTLAKAKMDNCCEGLIVFLQLLLQIAPPVPYMATD